MVQLSVMKMPAVPTHQETTIVPVILDMREMDSTALVNIQYIGTYARVLAWTCIYCTPNRHGMINFLESALTLIMQCISIFIKEELLSTSTYHNHEIHMCI